MSLPGLVFWIAMLGKRRAASHLIRASAALSAAGRPGKRTSGSAPADTSGTRSTLGESALRAFINGVRLNASLAADGRRTRSGMRLREKLETVK